MMAIDLLALLGRDVTSSEVRDAILTYQLTDVEEDPPFRRYVGSRKSGLDFLVENDRVIAIQIFMKAVQGFSSFSGVLPLRLQQNMSQEEVHKLLGQPYESDKHDSKYVLSDKKIKLVFNYDDSLRVSYLNIESV